MSEETKSPEREFRFPRHTPLKIFKGNRREMLERRASALRLNQESDRQDRLRRLYIKRKMRISLVNSMMKSRVPGVDRQSSIGSNEGEYYVESANGDSYMASLRQEVQEELQASSDRLKKVDQLLREFQRKTGSVDFLRFPLEVRLDNITYRVRIPENAGKIMTVYNSSNIYALHKWIKRQWTGKRKDTEGRWKFVLDSINLVLKPGKMYLVLGPPGAGKTTLLKVIAAQLKPDPEDVLEGSIYYNGRKLKESHKDFYIENAIAYIDQLDRHAPRLTVRETFEFAFQCKSGGKTVPEEEWLKTEQAKKAAREADREGLRVNTMLTALGLEEVQHTFVGDSNVRGISGGQRRRVTVGEMMMHRSPVLCGDEISTGLDAASTYDMIEIILHYGRAQKMTRVISLLQPSPETVSLFDEVIVMAEGKIIFCGPIEDVEDYFAEIGYKCPDFMDMADFLQLVSTDDGATLYDPPPEIMAVRNSAPSIAELAALFQNSTLGRKIKDGLNEPHIHVWDRNSGRSGTDSMESGVAASRAVMHKYMNRFPRSAYLIFKRFIILWLRDRRVIFAGIVKNVLMGVSVGGVFYNVEEPLSIIGVLFQAVLFIMLTAMQTASGLLEDRIIFYKHADEHFYSAWPFVFGRTLASIPQTIIDVFMFGSILYFMVGLGGRETGNFFIFISILITFALMINQQLSLFAAFSSSSGLQVYSACMLLLYILFGGFIIAPQDIPDYYYFVYWWNPSAWAYRSLVLNEFYSARWGNSSHEILLNLGFTRPSDDEPFSQDWVGFGFAYMIPYFLLCVVGTAILLTHNRNTGENVAPEILKETTREEVTSQSAEITIPFKPVDVSFQDISYEVTASTGKKTLKLLKNIDGIFRSGRMCALMGSSGAGKTTLMDVIALRKRIGKVGGKVWLNGWLQEPVSFRRCSGYVEQFDVQTPELTVRETILFSARLRLDPDRVGSEENLQAFVDQIIAEVELSDLAKTLVGSDEGLGLSFEQKKRLSIAVELGASPSIIFLDEPTSGLDARSALLVVKTLRRIANKGRTICATIHQPSSAVFEMFDDLLLLKKGGEVVYHGELGSSSKTLISYLESVGASKIEIGDNPANWMLRVISDPSMPDLPEAYRNSELFVSLQNDIEKLASSPNEELKIEYENEYAANNAIRSKAVVRRLRLIYWRSPTYNLARLTVSGLIAFILGSVFILKRTQQEFTEVEFRSRLSVIFLTFIITGIMAMLSVLPVMTKIRDMFYRHNDAGMYGSAPLAWALGLAEQPFIIMASSFFCVTFLAVSGMNENDIAGLIGFWGFFTFNFAIYSYYGQAFVCLVKPLPTAIILSSVFIGLNNFFAGLVVRPQLMVGNFYSLPYYISPSHYVYEGLIVTLFDGDERTVSASEDTEYYFYLGCTSMPCDGTVTDYINFFFGNQFSPSHIRRNAWICGLILVIGRVATVLALKYIRYS